MIVYCEECGFKNVIDEGRVKGERPDIRCDRCGEVLRFYGPRAKALKMERPRHLILKYGKVVVVMNPSNPRVEIGRQKGNDIQVSNNRVSRTHALIVYRDGNYYLTDQSSNGTYLLLEGHEGVTIKKKEILLTDPCVIGLGYKVDFKSPEAIHIRFEYPLR